jgi:hypothetical protein
MSSEPDRRERQVRAARNQSFFREINGRIREATTLLDTETAPSGDLLVDFICECADMSCAERLTLTLHTYSGLRERPTWFAVVRGHVYFEVERVVADENTHTVVEKFATAGFVAAVLGAREEDQRSESEPEGYDPEVDPARRRWLQNLVEICDQALAELPRRDPPPLELIGDFREFRTRLAEELRADASVETGVSRPSARTSAAPPEGPSLRRR